MDTDDKIDTKSRADTTPIPVLNDTDLVISDQLIRLAYVDGYRDGMHYVLTLLVSVLIVCVFLRRVYGKNLS